jgi:hypothetical protein
LEPISRKEDNEESITKKSESRNVGSHVDEEKTELMKEYDSIKGGGTIWTDRRPPLLECIRDPGKTTNKKIKRQMLKYMSLDDDLYWRTTDGVLLKCLGEEQAKVVVWEVHDGICEAHQSASKMNLWSTPVDLQVHDERRPKALKEIEKEKVKIAKAYNKRVVEKLFQVGDLVWKMILPLGNRSGKFGKWSPSWEGPFRVI